jgi:predicted secreted protein
MASVINGTNIVLYEYDSNAIYYFNGGTAQGTFDSIVCKELSRTQVAGTSVNFNKTGAGTIASFITDALDPGVTTIPAGTWTFSAYYSIANLVSVPQIKYELYKYNGSIATLLFSSVETNITSMTTSLYSTAMTVTQTTIGATDRLLIKVIYAGASSNPVTFYTQSTNVAQVTTTIPLGTPMGASTSCSFEASTEQVEVTSQTSAWFRQFKSDITSWTVNCDGFIALSGYSYLALMQKQLDRASIDVRFSIDNDNADASDTYGYSIVSGTANITSISLSAPVEGASTYSLALQGTGAYAITGTQVISGGSSVTVSSMNSYSYTAAGGETTVTFVAAIGSTCISVTRGGVEVRTIATSGVPTDENVSFNSATGVITFATARPLESDEFIRAIFA